MLSWQCSCYWRSSSARDSSCKACHAEQAKRPESSSAAPVTTGSMFRPTSPPSSAKVVAEPITSPAGSSPRICSTVQAGPSSSFSSRRPAEPSGGKSQRENLSRLQGCEIPRTSPRPRRQILTLRASATWERSPSPLCHAAWSVSTSQDAWCFYRVRTAPSVKPASPRSFRTKPVVVPTALTADRT